MAPPVQLLICLCLDRKVSNTTDFIENNPLYHGMQKPESCPEPIVIGGFDETTNNTDQPEDNMTEVETTFDGEQMTFAPRNEPSESTGPYKSQEEFIFFSFERSKTNFII